MLFVDYDIKSLEKAVSSQAEEIDILSRKNSALTSEIAVLKDQLAKGGGGGESPGEAGPTPVVLGPKPILGSPGAQTGTPVAIPVRPKPPIKNQEPKFNEFFMDDHLKYCPAQHAAGRKIEMLPCELYGVDVDISQAGIYFDGGNEDELVRVLGEIAKNKNARKVIDFFRKDNWGDQLEAQIKKAQKYHVEYQKIKVKWGELCDKRYSVEERLKAHPTDAALLEQRQSVIEEFREVSVKERNLSDKYKLKITPGQSQIDDKIKQEPYGDNVGEGPIGCPTNPSVNMLKIKIYNDVLDISAAGIYFDGGNKNELIKLLEKIKGEGDGIGRIFGKYGKVKDTILDSIDEKTKKLELHTKVYDEFRTLSREARRRSQNSADYASLKQQADAKYSEYVKLSLDLDRVEDLTPTLLKKLL